MAANAAYLLTGGTARWFAAKGWSVLHMPGGLIQATKRGHIAHGVKLEPGETTEAALQRLKRHVLEVYPGGFRGAKEAV